MKKYVTSIIILIALLLVVIYNNQITDFISGYLINEKEVYISNSNEYKKNDNFEYVKLSKDYIPYSYNDLINIIYSFLNNGWDTFTFYCPSEYTECFNDIKSISDNKIVLTDINNYVHPFNNFQSMNTVISSSGEVTINVKKVYTDEEIIAIKEKVSSIENTIYKDDMDDIEKLREAHDYIIENSYYDLDRKNKKSDLYRSNTAYGPLIEGYAICSGYADAMNIFISDLGIKNYKVASDVVLNEDGEEEGHVWNALYINDEWLHIDATWDDQIDTNGIEKLIHKFFLINTENMQKYAPLYHGFDTSVYREFFQ